MTIRVHFLILLAVIAVAHVARAGVIRDDRSQSEYLDLGASSAYASVGRIDTEGATFSSVASGTLIAPEWVLTAGHVLDGVDSMTFSLGGRSYTASETYSYPRWNGNLWKGFDLGLVHLSQAVTNVDPAQRYDGRNEDGMVATTVGYGMTGTGNTGAKNFDGRKRAGQNVVDDFNSSERKSRLFTMDFDDPERDSSSMGSSRPLDLEYLIAPGDSGGGVFADTKDGTVLIGVNSFGASSDGDIDFDYGDISGHTRVSSFNRWIDKILDGRISAASLQAMEILNDDIQAVYLTTPTAFVPEPAAISMLAAAALVLRRGYRREN